MVQSPLQLVDRGEIDRLRRMLCIFRWVLQIKNPAALSCRRRPASQLQESKAGFRPELMPKAVSTSAGIDEAAQLVGKLFPGMLIASQKRKSVDNRRRLTQSGLPSSILESRLIAVFSKVALVP